MNLTLRNRETVQKFTARLQAHYLHAKEHTPTHWGRATSTGKQRISLAANNDFGDNNGQKTKHSANFNKLLHYMAAGWPAQGSNP